MAKKRVARAIFGTWIAGAIRNARCAPTAPTFEAIGLRQRVGIDVDRALDEKPPLLGTRMTCRWRSRRSGCSPQLGNGEISPRARREPLRASVHALHDIDCSIE